MVFVSCSGCQRFVATSESSCPFCGVDIVDSSKKKTNAPRVARSVMLAALLAGSGCSMSNTLSDTGTDSTNNEKDADLPDADLDAELPDADVPDAVEDVQQEPPPLPPYGAPPPEPDAG